MRTERELKANHKQGTKNKTSSPERQQMLDGQIRQLVATIHDFFDESDACGPVCYLNELMKSRTDNAEGLRISSFLMQLSRFDKCISLLQK